MKIGNDHWLEGVERSPLGGGSEMEIRRFLVIHNTAGATGKSSIDYWRSPDAHGACAQIVIERDGKIIQCRPFNRTCGHAGPPGKSRWRDPKTGVRYNGLNSCSIGIELANAGFDTPGRDAYDWAARQPGFDFLTAKHKNGGPVVDWEIYPAAQLSACEELSKALVEHYNLDDLLGHEDCSAERKVDPGPAFPMQALRLACGFTTPLVSLRA